MHDLAFFTSPFAHLLCISSEEKQFYTFIFILLKNKAYLYLDMQHFVHFCYSYIANIVNRYKWNLKVKHKSFLMQCLLCNSSLLVVTLFNC